MSSGEEDWKQEDIGRRNNESGPGYILALGEAGARRLLLLDEIFGPHQTRPFLRASYMSKASCPTDRRGRSCCGRGADATIPTAAPAWSVSPTRLVGIEPELTLPIATNETVWILHISV